MGIGALSSSGYPTAIEEEEQEKSKRFVDSRMSLKRAYCGSQNRATAVIMYCRSSVLQNERQLGHAADKVGENQSDCYLLQPSQPVESDSFPWASVQPYQLRSRGVAHLIQGAAKSPTFYLPGF
jgi:hypothetical protein